MEKYNGWDKIIEQEQAKNYYKQMDFFLHSLPSDRIFPPENMRFNAFLTCRPEDVKVVIIGQDPYHNIGQANGLAFSVNISKLPPSLKNIYAELAADLGITKPTTGDLGAWARQGVLLLNTSLTVEAHKAGSHSKIGWQKFTDAIISYLNSKYKNIVYVIWGAHAYEKCKMINLEQNCTIISSHPSPLSCYKSFGKYPPFKGSHPFSKIDEYLMSAGKMPIDWRIK